MSLDSTRHARSQFSTILHDTVGLQNEESPTVDVPIDFEDYEQNDVMKSAEKSDSNDEEGSNSFQVKLFERVVDLGSFNNNTPMYVMCRDWVNETNSTHKVNEKKVFNAQIDPNLRWSSSDGANVAIQKVPDYVLTHQQPTVEQLCRRRKRVEDAMKGSHHPPKLPDLKKKWVSIRKSWQINNAHNELQFKKSKHLLQNMYFHSTEDR